MKKRRNKPVMEEVNIMAKMSQKAASRIQSASAKTGTNQSFATRAQRAAAKNQK